MVLNLKGMLLGLMGASLAAQGVSPYLPIQDAELNAHLDALAVVGDLPVLRKPYNLQAVKAAMASIRERHPDLHRELQAALRRYEQRVGLTRAEAAMAASAGEGDGAVIPNGGGERMDSSHRVEAVGQARLGDHLLLVAGGRATDRPGKATLAGSHVALGWKHLQVDVGYRDRWLSPFQDSAMVLSTQAEPPLSVGVSSPMPLPGFWNLHYEVFLARLGPLQRVQEEDGVHLGRPYLLGTHLSLEPVRGWTVSATRTLQFGGDRVPVTPGRIWQAFWNPVKSDNLGSFGNQEAALASRMNFQGPTPFSIYVEYAAEDTASLSNTRFGNLALSAGLHIPFLPEGLLGRRWAFTYEFSEWQDAWWVHHKYLDGYTHEGVVLGHWGGEMRLKGDGVGASAHALKLRWRPRPGWFGEGTLRLIRNEDYGLSPYRTGRSLDFRFTGPLAWGRWSGRLLGGQDVFGQRFARGEVAWLW